MATAICAVGVAIGLLLLPALFRLVSEQDGYSAMLANPRNDLLWGVKPALFTV